MELRTFAGTWWLPENPDDHVGGILTVDASGSCELQLTQDLISSPLLRNNTDEDDGSPGGSSEVIHGAASGEDFTVLHSLYVGGGLGRPFDRAAQLLKPQVVVRGVHLSSGEDRIFSAMELELDNLTAWSSISGFSSKMNAKALQAQSEDYWVRYQLARPGKEIGKGTLDEFEVDLKWQSTFNPHVTPTHAGRHLRASESVKVRFASPAPLAWNQFLDASKSFQDLLTFATRHACAIRSCSLIIHPNEHSAQKPVELIRPALIAPKADSETTPLRFLFQARDISFPDLLKKWDKLYKDIGLGIHVLFGLDYEQGGYVENRIMNATAAAESIHRALFPSATGLSLEEHQAGLTKIKEAIAQHSNKQWFLERLSNSPGFVDRMKELAAIPSQEAVKALVADVDQWTRWLRDARNAVAHLEGKNLQKIPEGARYDIPNVTRALLHLVFLAKLGLSSDVQMKAVNVIYSGTTERFRRDVREKLAKQSDEETK